MVCIVIKVEIWQCYKLAYLIVLMGSVFFTVSRVL